MVSYSQRTSDNLLTVREAWRAYLRRVCTDDQPSILRGLRLSRKRRSYPQQLEDVSVVAANRLRRGLQIP